MNCALPSRFEQWCKSWGDWGARSGPLDVETKSVARGICDAVVIASSHFEKPYVPLVPGVPDWLRKHPGPCSHSLTYRNPSS